MNSLRYLPFAFICLRENTSVGKVGRGALRSALSLSLHLPPSTTQYYPHHHPPDHHHHTPHPPAPPFPLCALNQHKFGFIVFVCLFALISFPFQRLPIRDLQTSEAEWQGSRGFTFVPVCVCVCVRVSEGLV